MRIPVDLLKDSAKRYSASASSAAIAAPAARTLAPPPSQESDRRKAMLASVRVEPVAFAFERVIGNNDSVYSNFVELIANAKQKVGRIVIRIAGRPCGYATGFMVSESLLLTNWHVFNTKDAVSDSEVQFGYELDMQGNALSPHVFRLRPETFFFSNRELDYCFVAVAPVDVSGSKALAEIGYLFLDPGLGKLSNNDHEMLNIIHHPEGDYKQLSIRENELVKMLPNTVWYRTDTAQGSSGSPVLNDQWQVVALHHMGLARKNANNQYVDKHGDVISVVDGKVDAASVVWDANEGIRISVILENVFQECPDTEILKGLQIKPAAVASAESKAVTNQVTALKTDGNSPVTISLPTSLIQSHGQISITINNGSGLQPVPMAPPAAAGTETVLLDAQEIKKLEQETDYAQCRGYQSHFLGIDVPLPQPKPAYRKLIAKQKANNKIELAYYNYSVIFHALRKMPIISAVNVEGNLAQRTDKQARKDNWLRDNRISFDIQLADAFYKASGFDRGHMSRREDAYWGDGPEDAKRNADLTCTYTNACPQAPTINQSQRNGLWGQLEKVVLENGAERESGRTTRISVFNGPIFKDSDPVFRGVHVPMDFYKIVLWLTDAGGLKATAFVLSQEKEVGDINFEQLDIDENTQFQAYQCSIQSLEAMTGIDFSGITAYDTFESVGGHEKTAMTATELATHVAKNYKTVA